jgi:hypothetical protein
VAAPHKLGVCQIVDRTSADVSPIFDANSYVGRYMGNTMNFIKNSDGSHRTDITLRIIKQPEHGELVQRYPDATDFDQYDYKYVPNMEGTDSSDGYYDGEDYVDGFVMEVSAGGITVEIHYRMSVGAHASFIGSDGKRTFDPTRCPKPNREMWKISTTPDTPLDAPTLQSLLSFTGITGITGTAKVEISDLAGSAVGQTTGTAITLDTTAAGNGWFVDSTPSDNSEYLPTSNPNEWIAKAGTAAAGKMDMLSVLLHEYGHALGIDHSTNPNDFMSTTLSAGVRRLPSTAEMALMQQLAAQAKATLTNGSLNAADGWSTQGKREKGQT